MFEIKSGSSDIVVSSYIESYSNPVKVTYTVSVSQRLGQILNNFGPYDIDGYELREIINEHRERKKLIAQNPAVKDAYDAFRTVCELVREPKS